jgi:hypothetical protein
MRKLIQYIQKFKLDTQILIGSVLATLYFIYKNWVFKSNDADHFLNHNIGNWITVPFILLSVVIIFYILHLKFEKQEKLNWQLIAAFYLANIGLFYYFIF